MDYIKIRFGGDLDPLGSHLERTMEDIFRPRPVNPMFASHDRCWRPQMDIYETPEEIIIRAELAGVEAENLEVEINRKAIRIAGYRGELPRIDQATYRLAEIQYGRFERMVYMPAPIDVELTSSSFTDGFLQIRVAKLPSSVTHQIPIEDG